MEILYLNVLWPLRIRHSFIISVFFGADFIFIYVCVYIYIYIYIYV